MSVKLDLELNVKEIESAKASEEELTKQDKPDFFHNFKDYKGAYSSGIYPGTSPGNNKQDS